MRIYVGNLPYGATEEEVQDAFANHGEVESVVIIRDRETGRSKGFGFVEMTADEDAEAAIAALNGNTFQSRTLTVNQARPRETRGFGGGGGGGGGGGRW